MILSQGLGSRFPRRGIPSLQARPCLHQVTPFQVAHYAGFHGHRPMPSVILEMGFDLPDQPPSDLLVQLALPCQCILVIYERPGGWTNPFV